MQTDILSSLRQLSDADLVGRVKDLAAREHGVTALLVAHLAELDTRDVHLRAGYSSLFCYCRDALALSEHEAYNRIEVARAARRFPVILEMLAEGVVNLTTVRLLAPHLTPENHRCVLDSARGKRKTEVEEIVAGLSPRPDAPSFLRKLPAASPTPPASSPGPEAVAAPVMASPALASSAAAVTFAQVTVAPVPETSAPAIPAPLVPPPYPAAVTPLSPDRYKLQLTIGGDTLEKLRLAKDLLRHAIPSGDDAAILDRALTALLAELARKKSADVQRPRRSGGTAPGSRHIPAEVRRAVWRRDLARCGFVGTNGRRCRERAFLEFHHLKPHAVGGETTVTNVQLRCRAHNGYEAKAYFVHRRELVPERVARSGVFHSGVPDR
jgi:hypothetical protein